MNVLQGMCLCMISGCTTCKSLSFVYNRKSASCTHVLGLHALVSMTPSEFQLPGSDGTSTAHDDEVLPITSYACQWNVPRM